MAKTQPFPQYAPDLSDIGSSVSLDIENVVARADGYGPFRDLTTFTLALPSACRGYFFARRGDGSIAVFAGTVNHLYLLDNTTFAWAPVSKGGTPYSTLVATANWQFAQFNDLVIAVQANTAPQKYTLTSGGNFADLGGTPPAASRVAIVNYFVVLTGLVSDPRRVHWSDLDGPETWTAGVGLCDFQDLPDGGSTHAISGGDAYGVVFQDESIRTFTYAPGSPVVFQINRISTQETLFADYSVINVGDRTFYCGASGFKMIKGGAPPVQIGKERIDRTFFADIDRSNLQLMIGATDPTATRVYWGYKSQQGAANLIDTVLSYDYDLDRWTTLAISCEYLASLAKPGLTLEQLDAIAPGAISITGAVNNGAGLIRLTLPTLSNTYFTIPGQNFIVVQGVNGVPANGTWKFTVVDATHIDLIGSAFSGAYVSGGAIGGSLDALPFSLDSVSKASVAQLSAMGSLHSLGFFDGPNLEATMETSELDGQGRLQFCDGVAPMTDSPDAVCSMGYRMRAQTSVVYTAESAMNGDGVCPLLIEARYMRAKMRIPYGSTWSYASGVQPTDNAQYAGTS